MMPLILASVSPRRFQLLSKLELPFTVVPAEVDEHLGDGLSPDAMVLHNARLKAEAVSRRHPDQVILAADTTVCLDGQILNKPANLDEAWTMLGRLSGKTHQVFTGLAVIGPRPPGRLERVVESRVTFKPLTNEVIADYFQKVNPLDKAGAYGIQENASERIIETFDGSISNVTGLPLEETREALAAFGFSPAPDP